MTLLSQSEFLKALGWALLNSLWQFGLLWLIFIILTSLFKRITPAGKYAFALGTIASGAIWFATGLITRFMDPDSSLPYSNGSYFTAFSNAIGSYLDNSLSYLSTAYLVIVAALFMRFFRYFYSSFTIQTKGHSKLRAELRLYVKELADQLGIRRKVSVWVSEHIDTPMIIGFLKPTILIPIASINQLTVRQLEAVLLHELAHIKRNDYVVNLFIATVEIIFFFNPFSRLLIESVKQEREKSCDDWVIQFRFDPYQYASALLQLEQCRTAFHSTSLAATGEDRKVLLHRIQRIMGLKNTHPKNRCKLLTYFVLIGLISLIAFLDPGTMAVKKLVSNFPIVDNYLPAITDYNDVNIMAPRTITKPDSYLQQKKATAKKPVEIVPYHNTPEKPENIPDENGLLLTDVSYDEDYEHALIASLTNSVSKEERDFSIPEQAAPVIPPILSVSEFPYVPQSSFSYFLEDTSKPKTKLESYKELVARESLVQAKNAVDKIDWTRIEKSLQKSKIDLVKLRREIQKSLQELNWLEINQQVKDSLNNEAADNLKASLLDEYEAINNFKVRQRQYQEINMQLLHQQEQLKRDEELQRLNIEKKLQKRKIVYI
ncbi:MAG: M56 family metallopeptidase [Chitinophagaceae bacterium]